MLANNEYYKNFDNVYNTDINKLYYLSIQTHKAKLDKNKKKKK